MNAIINILLLIIAGAIFCLWFLQPTSKQNGGGDLSLNFSPMTDDISQGNPVSWSGRENLPGHHSGNEFADQPALTFWGSGIPLTHETRLGIPDPVVRPRDRIHTLSSANVKCSPECCPSPYSCDHGCLCYRRNRQGGQVTGPTLRKSFT